MTSVLSQVCRANLLILQQKVALMDALVSRHATPEKAQEAFYTICPIVGASIGMHLRHSMDHIERASVAAAASTSSSFKTVNSISIKTASSNVIHYDLRNRGGTDETNMEVARNKISNVSNILQYIKEQCDIMEQEKRRDFSEVLQGKNSVEACFFLSGDANSPEVGLHSTIARELGFAAHHAIHHLVLVKIIALNCAGLQETDLPRGLGMAPSTIIHHLDATNT